MRSIQRRLVSQITRFKKDLKEFKKGVKEAPTLFRNCFSGKLRNNKSATTPSQGYKPYCAVLWHQNIQIECTDAIRVIRSRDYPNAFFYCDPPYFNSDCGHYDGYSVEDFNRLLDVLQSIQGKFLMSSYPSKLLEDYTTTNHWSSRKIEQPVTVANGTGGAGKRKIEVLTANYDLCNPKLNLTLF